MKNKKSKGLKNIVGRKYDITVFVFLISAVLLLSMGTATSVTTTGTSSSTSETSATNMVVDFDSTSFDSNVRRGDSGVLNLVIKNTGGRKAENLEVWLPSTATVRIDKRFYVGRMDPGESKAIPVLFTVDGKSKTGLTAIQVYISYNGLKSDGTSDDNKLTTWEIPLNVVGNPLFQITAEKTTYYKDTLDELKITGVTKDPVKDLEATLSSNCATIIDSSRKYVGEVASGQTFNLAYPIKPSSSGACTAYLRLSYTDETGSKALDNITLGLNVEDAGVDFKIVNVSYTSTGPGEQTDLKIILRNVGNADADDVTLYLNLSSPFTPVDTSEKYIPQIQADKDVEVDFRLAVGWDAETTAYSIPLRITYKVGGTSYSATKDVGLDVTGKVILEVIQVQATGSSVRIDVANIGTRTADAVKATLIVSAPLTTSNNQTTSGRSSQTGGFMNRTAGENMNRSGVQQRLVSYKSDIKSNKQTTFTFSTSATGGATLELEYTGPNNERVTQTERITLSNGGTSNMRSSSSSGTSTTTYAIAAAVLVIAYLAYRRFRSRKNK